MQRIVWNISAFIVNLRIDGECMSLAVGCRLTTSGVNSNPYNRQFTFQHHNGLVATVGFQSLQSAYLLG